MGKFHIILRSHISINIITLIYVKESAGGPLYNAQYYGAPCLKIIVIEHDTSQGVPIYNLFLSPDDQEGVIAVLVLRTN